MQTYTDTIATSLDGARVLLRARLGETPSGIGRDAVIGLELGSGELVSTPAAAALREDWLADPERAVKKLRTCGESWIVRPTSSGAWTSSPMTCGCSVCPLCITMKIAEKRRQWERTLRELVKRGYTIVLLTRTRAPNTSVYGPCDTVVTKRDLARFPELKPESIGSAGRACGSMETLGEAWQALDDATRALADSNAFITDYGMKRRDWWAETVACSIDAIEATQVSPRTNTLRWHVHGHQVLALAPGTVSADDVTDGKLNDNCKWWTTYKKIWLAETKNATEAAQDCSVVAGEKIDEAIREVVKYPGKISEMTDAGVIEWLVTAKGRRPHRVGGALHAGTSRGRVARCRALRTVAEGLEEEQIGPVWSELVGLLRLPETASRADVDAAIAELESRLVPAQRRAAVDVGAAIAVADLEIRSADDPPVGDVYGPPEPSIGDRPGRWHLLTVTRLAALVSGGIRCATGYRIGGCQGALIPDFPPHLVQREIRRWRPPKRRSTIQEGESWT